MSMNEQVEIGETKYRVKLNGTENVIVFFQAGAVDEYAWGFTSIADFRTWLKMLLRFDETLTGRAVLEEGDLEPMGSIVARVASMTDEEAEAAGWPPAFREVARKVVLEQGPGYSKRVVPDGE